MPRRKDCVGFVPLPSRDPPTTSKAGVSTQSIPKSGDNASGDMMECALSRFLNDNHLNEEENDSPRDNADEKTTEGLKRHSLKLKQLFEVGKLVGERGNPGQVLQDAHLTKYINQMALPAIRRIQISRSIWTADAPEKFTKLLLTQLALRCCDAEEFEEGKIDTAQLSMSSEGFVTTFVEEYLGNCAVGLAPAFSTVSSAVVTDVSVVAPSRKKTQKNVARKNTLVPFSVRKAESMAAGTEHGGGYAVTQPSLMGRKPLNTQASAVNASNSDPDPSTTLKRKIEADFIRQGRRPVFIMPLLVNPDSFQASVANFFLFSTLIQTDDVRLGVQPKTGLPVCTPLKMDKSADSSMDLLDDIGEGAAVDKVAGQTVMWSLRESDWREMVDLIRRDAERHEEIPASMEC